MKEIENEIDIVEEEKERVTHEHGIRFREIEPPATK
jgi:hypothetical protein